MINRRHVLFCAPAIIAYPTLMRIAKRSVADYAHNAFSPWWGKDDGVALRSMPHPGSWDLTVSGFNQFNERVIETFSVPESWFRPSGGLRIAGVHTGRWSCRNPMLSIPPKKEEPEGPW